MSLSSSFSGQHGDLQVHVTLPSLQLGEVGMLVRKQMAAGAECDSDYAVKG